MIICAGCAAARGHFIFAYTKAANGYAMQRLFITFRATHGKCAALYKHHFGTLGYSTYGPSIQKSKANNQFFFILFLNFQ